MSEFKVGDTIVTVGANDLGLYEKGETGVVVKRADRLGCYRVDFGDRARQVHASRMAHVEEVEASGGTKGAVGDRIRVTNAYGYHDQYNGREGDIRAVGSLDVHVEFDNGDQQYFAFNEYELLGAPDETAESWNGYAVGDRIVIVTPKPSGHYGVGDTGAIVASGLNDQVSVKIAFDRADTGNWFVCFEEFEPVGDETVTGSHSFLDAGDTPSPHDATAPDAVKNYHVSIAADGLDVLCDKATNDQVSRIIEILLEES